METRRDLPDPPPPRNPVLVAAVCALGLACVMFDQTSLVVAVATIGKDLDAGLAGLQWLSALMPLVAASAMPASGALAARYGARSTLRAGLIVLAVGALGASLSGSLEMLIASRVVEGFGAALILPSGPALLGANVPSGPPRHRAIGYWLLVSSSGLILGPLVGGVLVQEFGWRITFVVLVPLALIAAGAVSVLGNTALAAAGRLDLAGLSLICLSLAVLCWALIETGRGNSPAALVAAGYAVAVLLIGLFVLVERRARNPVLDLTVLNTPTLRVLFPAVLVYNAIINGSAFVISIHLQEGRGLSAGATGALLLIANLGMPLAGPVTAALRAFIQPSSLMMVSLLALVGCFGLMGLGDLVSTPALLLPLVILGLAAGVLYSIDTLTVLDAAEGPGAAKATAALALMRQVGSVLGIAALASLGQVAVSAGIAKRGEQPALIGAGIVMLLLVIRLVPLRRRLAS